MHIGSFWGMNFSGMFLPLSLGKWHRRGLQMELPSFTGYSVQTGQLDWTVHEKKRDSQPHCRAWLYREWEICLKQNPLADCHYLTTSRDLGAPCTT